MQNKTWRNTSEDRGFVSCLMQLFTEPQDEKFGFGHRVGHVILLRDQWQELPSFHSPHNRFVFDIDLLYDQIHIDVIF